MIQASLTATLVEHRADSDHGNGLTRWVRSRSGARTGGSAGHRWSARSRGGARCVLHASRTPPPRSGARLLARLERGQRFAGFAVAVRCSAEPVVRAVQVAVLTQDDAEIALGRGVIGLGRPVEPVNRAL